MLIAGEVNWWVMAGGLHGRRGGRQMGSHNLEGQCVVGIEMNLELDMSWEYG